MSKENKEKNDIKYIVEMYNNIKKFLELEETNSIISMFIKLIDKCSSQKNELVLLSESYNRLKDSYYKTRQINDKYKNLIKTFVDIQLLEGEKLK